jgi:hypothetical protein
MAVIASKDGSPSERIAAAFQRLNESSTHLNAASDELGQSIRALDLALQKLNLGVKAYVKCAEYQDPSGEFEDHYIEYTKVGGKWGIALSTREGDRRDEMYARTTGEWLFNDAPRSLRAEAVDKLPDLVEALVNEADKTTAKIMDKTAVAKDLAKTVNAIAAQPRK